MLCERHALEVRKREIGQERSFARAAAGWRGLLRIRSDKWKLWSTEVSLILSLSFNIYINFPCCLPYNSHNLRLMLHQTIYSSWKFKENVLLGVSWEWKDEANINATLCTWTWSKWRSTINCQCNLSECSKHVHMWLTWHENFKHVWTKIYYWFRGLSWERKQLLLFRCNWGL